MKYLQFLSFEISWRCNLADLHQDKCPVKSTRQLYAQPLADYQIISVAKDAYEIHGFDGLIAFHFYNEPLLEWERIKYLMHEISEKTGRKKNYCLWTNGELLKKSMLPFLGMMGKIVISNYFNKDYEWVRQSGCEDVQIIPGILDDRMQITGLNKGKSPCTRIFNELIIDYYGYAHPCCIDYSGQIGLGNVQQDGFDEVVDRWLSHRQSVWNEVGKYSHDLCQRCHKRDGLGMLYKLAFDRIKEIA